MSAAHWIDNSIKQRKQIMALDLPEPLKQAVYPRLQARRTVCAAGLVISLLVIPGCTVGPDYKPPVIDTTDQWSTTASAVNDDTRAPDDWWTRFEDSMLETCIRQAVNHNRTLQAATANVLRARALRKQAGSSLLPAIDSSFGRTRQGTSGTTSNTFSAGSRRTIYDAGVDASWELDIFGGLRRSTNASDARLESAIANKDAVLLGIITEVARSYFEVLGLQKRIQIIEKNISLQEQTFGLVEDLFDAGEATEFDLSRARAQGQLTRSRLPDLKAEMKAGVFRLSVLLGKPPESLLGDFAQSRPMPRAPDAIATGIRSDVLRRRPDIRIAERELAAATEDIGVQVAELFPRFFLTGAAGRASSSFGDLSETLSDTFSFAQLMQWPIFRGGEIRARIDVQKAEAAQAAAGYEQAVLEALRDVESALTRYVEKRATNNQLHLAFGNQERAAQLARILFNAGETDFLAVLDAERELTDVEDNLVISETDILLNLVTLYSALGGGWEPFQSP